MKKPLLEKTILRELLQYDALEAAEKMTGKSYKEDSHVAGLGMLLMMENSQAKKEFLKLNDDTQLFNNLDNYLRIANEEGFKIVLKEDFTENDYLESLYVLWNDQYGILMSFDSYESERVNGGAFYYNWKPKSTDQSFCRGKFTESGCFNNEHGVWVGHHDCREALRLHLSDLRENGTFIKPWIGSQFLWLMHYGDTKPKDYDYKAIVAKRIEKLPENVRRNIGEIK